MNFLVFFVRSISFSVMIGACFFFSACTSPDLTDQAHLAPDPLIEVGKSGLKASFEDIKLDRLTIDKLDDLIAESGYQNVGLIDLSGSDGALYSYDPEFYETQSGSYIAQISSSQDPKEALSEVTKKVVDHLLNTRECRKSCSEALKESISDNSDELMERLETISREALVNEILNHRDYLVFYHGFPSTFRLYQDVLKAVKTFEYQKEFKNSYFFRDFAFDDNKVKRNEFLKAWWPEYLKYAAEENLPVYPQEGVQSPGKSMGLTLYPDSISFAQNYLLSSNLSLFGNTLSPMNSSIFFFINSSSATGINIGDWLIEKALSPYILDDENQFDESKFQYYLVQLKVAFDEAMADSGGQLAQIFIKKDIANYIAYASWNGGEPIWASRELGRVAFSLRDKERVWKPLNIFWPKNEIEMNGVYLPKLSWLMNLYTSYPDRLASFFPVTNSIFINISSSFLKVKKDAQQNKEFLSRDLLQARIVPNPKYFANPRVVASKLYTYKPVDKDLVEKYEKTVRSIVREIFSEFLDKVSSEEQFKGGQYPLKNLFMQRRN